jgi:hypothetical protein
VRTDMTFSPISLPELFSIDNINVHLYGDDVVLSTKNENILYQIHLYEIELLDRKIYCLNIGQIFEDYYSIIFCGKVKDICVRFAKDDNTWDFHTISLQSIDGGVLRIGRDDAAFPEPTLKQIPNY